MQAPCKHAGLSKSARRIAIHIGNGADQDFIERHIAIILGAVDRHKALRERIQSPITS